MKKIILLLALIFLSTLGNAEASIFSEVISKVSDSIVSVDVIGVNQFGQPETSGGTGIIIKEDKFSSIVLTAFHVVNIEEPKVIVTFKDKRLTAKTIFRLKYIDAAYLILDGPLGGKPVTFNLSQSIGEVDVIVCGFGMELRVPDKKISPTFSMGTVSRMVADKISNNNYEIVESVIYGNALVVPGFSGGPCFNENYELIGMSVAFTPRNTIFIDCRRIWNEIPELNDGRFINVPALPSFNVLNLYRHSRIPLSPINDSVLVDDKEIILESLLNDVLNDSAWLLKVKKFKVNSKIYRIRELIFETRDSSSYYVSNVIDTENERKYIFCVEDGWKLIVFLDEE